MVKRAMTWFTSAVILGGTMFQLGCGGFGGISTRILTAILNEDLFG
jgi:hypothetical protein